MEEEREQPTMEPATALNGAEEKSAESEVGSQGELGKFKSASDLLEAYNNLQAEFTRKCQLLSSLQKDKMQKEEDKESSDENIKQQNEESNSTNDDITKEEFNQNLNAFLEANSEAAEFAEEIKNKFSEVKTKTSPFEDAWARVVFSMLKDGKLSDNMIDQYLITNQNVQNKVIESYLKDLQNDKPPLVISSSGERLSQVEPDSPKTLAEAKAIVDKMFS